MFTCLCHFSFLLSSFFFPYFFTFSFYWIVFFSFGPSNVLFDIWYYYTIQCSKAMTYQSKKTIQHKCKNTKHTRTVTCSVCTQQYQKNKKKGHRLILGLLISSYCTTSIQLEMCVVLLLCVDFYSKASTVWIVPPPP